MSGTRWDLGDAEPEGVDHVHDLIAEDDPIETPDSAHWGRTASGEWKGYKDHGKRYLSWDELVRRWGPVEQREGC